MTYASLMSAIIPTFLTGLILWIMVKSRDFHFSGVAVFLLLLALSICEWVVALE